MELAANEINTISQNANIAKVVGSSMGVIAGVSSLALGAAATLVTGGLAAPILIGGAVVGATGLGGALTSGGASIVKAVKLPKLLEDAKCNINKEIDEYRMVIANLDQLTHKVISGEIPMNDTVEDNAVVKMLSDICRIDIAEASSVAAAG